MSTPIVFALHKPKGITCDLSVNAPPNPKRPKDIKTWFDSLAPNLRHIGRLDKPTTGLLLATNTDGGALTARIITPGNISKTYVATVKLTNINQPTPEQLKSLLTNIELPDGMAHFDNIIIVKRHSITYQEIHVTHFVDLQVKISIGKNRIVRRLLAKAGLPVRELKRIAIGGLNIKDLNLPNRSDSVRLTQDEIDRIFVGSKDSGNSGNNGGSGGADSSKVDDLHAEIEISSQSKKRKNSSSSSVSSSSSSTGLQVETEAEIEVQSTSKKAKIDSTKAKIQSLTSQEFLIKMLNNPGRVPEETSKSEATTTVNVAAVGKYVGDLAVWFDEHGHYVLDDSNYADKNDDLFGLDMQTGIWKRIGKFDVKNCIENPGMYFG